MFKKICIVGAGAIGGWIGAQLAAQGHAVNVVARGATLQISGASPKLRQLAALYGVGELLGL